MIRPSLCLLLMSALVTACSGSGHDGVRRGAVLYATNCAACHGGDAKGGGGGGVYGLSKTPPDLTRLRSRNGGTFPVYETAAVLEGYAIGGMRGRQMVGFTSLQSDRKKRVRVDRTRLRTTATQADLLLFLESVQRP